MAGGESDEVKVGIDSWNESLKQTIDYMERLQDLSKQTASNLGSKTANSVVNDTASYKAHTDAVKEAIEIDKEAIKQTVILNAAKAQLRQGFKDELSVQNAATDSITAMNVQLKIMQEQWNNADAIQRAKLTPGLNELRNKIMAARESIGQFNMSIGNYAKANANLGENIKKTAEATRGFTGLAGLLGEALGLNKEVTEGLMKVHSAAREGMRSLNELTEGFTNTEHEAAEGTAAFAEAQEVALGPIGWVIIGLSALGVAIGAYIMYTDEAKKKEESYSKAMDGTIITDKKLRDSYNESIITLGKLNDEYGVIMGTMTKFQAKQNDLARNYRKDLANLQDEQAKAIADASWLTQGRHDADVLKARTAFLQQYNELTMKYADELRNATAEANKKDEEEEKKKQDDLAKSLLEGQERIAELRNKLVDNERTRELNEINIREEFSIKKMELEKKDQALINQVIEEASLERLEIIKKYQKKEEEIKRQGITDELNFEYEITTRMQKEADEKAKKEAEEQEKIQQDMLNWQYDTLKKMQSDIDKLKEEEAKKEKARLEKAHEAYVKAQQDTLKALQEALDAQNQAQQDALRTQTDMLQNEAQVQATLAAAGRKNSLDQVMAAENRAAEQQMKLQRQQQREKEAMALAELFISAEEAFLKGGSSQSEAMAQALMTVLLTKGIASGLAGAFYYGTEDTGGPGNIDSRGGKLAILHPHERVIDAEKNALLGGISNDELISLALMPKIDLNKKVSDDGVIREIKSLKAEMAAVKEAIQNQPQYITYKHGDDSVVERHHNGHKQTRIIKNVPPITFRG